MYFLKAIISVCVELQSVYLRKTFIPPNVLFTSCRMRMILDSKKIACYP